MAGMDTEADGECIRGLGMIDISSERPLPLLDIETAVFRGGNIGAGPTTGEFEGDVSLELPPVIMILPADAVRFSQPGLETTGGGIDSNSLSFVRAFSFGFFTVRATPSVVGPGLFSLEMIAPLIILLIDDLRR
jgi:hypothetical protein